MRCGDLNTRPVLECWNCWKMPLGKLLIFSMSQFPMFNAVPTVSHPYGFKGTDSKQHRCWIPLCGIHNTAPKSLHQDYSQTEDVACIQEKKILLLSLNHPGKDSMWQTGLEHTQEAFVSHELGTLTTAIISVQLLFWSVITSVMTPNFCKH